MITPTVGRIVWFYTDGIGTSEYRNEKAAIVTRVWNDRMVNLCVFDDTGATPKTSVPLVQPEDEKPAGEYCAWMPYQVVKASGSESGEKAAGSQTI